MITTRDAFIRLSAQASPPDPDPVHTPPFSVPTTAPDEPGTTVLPHREGDRGPGTRHRPHRGPSRSLTMALVAAVLSVLVVVGASTVLRHRTPAVATPGATTTSALPSTDQTPRQAALAWFAATNQKDQSRVVAAFTANTGVRAAWTTNPPSTWPTFSSISCTPQGRSATTALVSCTFTESQAPAVGKPDSFWTISFQRQDQRWLIDNYGQG